MKQKIITRIKSFLMPNSLRTQLLFRTLVILAVLLVLIGLLQYVFMREVIYRNKAESLQSQAMSIPHFWEPMTDVGDGKDRPPRIFMPDASLALIDLNGNFTVLSNGREDVTPPKLNYQEYLVAALKEKPHLNYRIIKQSNQPEQLVVLQPIISRLGRGQVIGVLQISTMTEPLRDLLIRQLLTFLFLSLIAMLVGIFGFLPVLRKTLVPLFNMVETTEQIDAGNLDKRFPTQQGQMEIDRLAESFNGMLERLEASFAAERETKEQMRRFIADASHELRTPLTSIHGFLEVLLRGAANQPDQLHKALKSMYGESERVNKLVQDLLLLAKLDRTPNIELAEGSLTNIIQDMEPQLRILAGNRKLNLELEPNLTCRYDADKIKQVVLNLFHNAVHHTEPEKGQIKISLAKKDEGVVLSVQDNGPGISEDHLNRVFDRFYRIDSSRTRKYGGAGLGLAISKSIVDAHGGTISVASQVGEGTTFSICLPG